MLVLVAATLLGIVFTLFAGSEPGFVLGLFITVGSVAAVLGVRRGLAYLVFPLPAFAFFVAAVITGKVKDSSLTSSTAGLGVGFLQWIADIFYPMVIATILVLLVGGTRWLLAHQLVSGQFSMSVNRQGVPRPTHAPAAGPRPNGGRGDRVPRDPWGDPRQPPADPRARSSRDGRPVTPGQSRDRAPRPPDREPVSYTHLTLPTIYSV